MLIYIPTTSRAAIATLICIIACCNLNYFNPHKNRVLFWLSQLSFITTASKYIIALLIASSSEFEPSGMASKTDMEHKQLITAFLIGVDVFFLVSSVLAIVASLLMLRRKVAEMDKLAEKQLVKVLPSLRNKKGLQNWGR